MKIDTLIKKFEEEIERTKTTKVDVKLYLNLFYNIVKQYMSEKSYDIFFKYSYDYLDTNILEMINGDFIFNEKNILLKFKNLEKDEEYLFRIDNVNFNLNGSAVIVKNEYIDNTKSKKKISKFIDKYTSKDDKYFICRSKFTSYKSLNIIDEYYIVTTLNDQPISSKIKENSEYGRDALNHNLEIADVQNANKLKEHFNLKNDIPVYVIDRRTKFINYK